MIGREIGRGKSKVWDLCFCLVFKYFSCDFVTKTIIHSLGTKTKYSYNPQQEWLLCIPLSLLCQGHCFCTGRDTCATFPGVDRPHSHFSQTSFEGTLWVTRTQNQCQICQHLAITAYFHSNWFFCEKKLRAEIKQISIITHCMCLCMGCGSLLLKPASFVACKVVVALRRINNSNKAENQYTKTTQLTTLGVAKIHTSLGKMQYTKSETALISLVSFYNLFFFFLKYFVFKLVWTWRS